MILVIISGSCFSKNIFNEINTVPINITNKHSCADDRMILIDYNGPKAQVIWKDNTRSFYCETREVFSQLMNTNNSQRIKAVFVQDFSNLEWGSYTDKWINIEDAFFVINSKKYGAMGISYVPFKSFSAAKLFHKENGGQILQYKQINNKTLYISEQKNKRIIEFIFLGKKMIKWLQIN